MLKLFYRRNSPSQNDLGVRGWQHLAYIVWTWSLCRWTTYCRVSTGDFWGTAELQAAVESWTASQKKGLVMSSLRTQILPFSNSNLYHLGGKGLSKKISIINKNTQNLKLIKFTSSVNKNVISIHTKTMATKRLMVHRLCKIDVPLILICIIIDFFYLWI